MCPDHYTEQLALNSSLGAGGPLQRTLLERLAALLASVLGNHTPLAVATMEAMGLLLEVLGEINADEVAVIGQPVLAKLLAGSSCLRRQVCRAL